MAKIASETDSAPVPRPTLEWVRAGKTERLFDDYKAPEVLGDFVARIQRDAYHAGEKFGRENAERTAACLAAMEPAQVPVEVRTQPEDVHPGILPLDGKIPVRLVSDEKLPAPDVSHIAMREVQEAARRDSGLAASLRPIDGRKGPNRAGESYGALLHRAKLALLQRLIAACTDADNDGIDACTEALAVVNGCRS